MATKRKRPPRVLPTWIEALDDLHDYKQPPARRACRKRVPEEPAIIVMDDWPDFVPITEAELRVMEAHFAEELDEIFGPLP